MRAPLLALAATTLLAAALPAQGGKEQGAPVISGVFDRPVERVYRSALDVIGRVGYQPPFIMLLDEALATAQPSVVSPLFKIPTVAQLTFERRGDSTKVVVEVVGVDVERQARCGSEECTMAAMAGVVSIMGRLKAALDSLPPLPRTAADSLREVKSLGYAPEAPIRVGGGVEDGARKERAYLASLRGPGGEAVSFVRIGSCCPFVPPGGEQPTARIDAYEVTYPGLAKPVVLYMDVYAAADGGLVPAGFTRAPDLPAPST